MLRMLKEWISNEKAMVVGVVQGRLPLDAVRRMECLIRTYNLPGVLRVISPTVMEFVLEGSKPRIDRFLLELPHHPAMAGQVLKLAWGEYKGKYQNFRVTL